MKTNTTTITTITAEGINTGTIKFSGMWNVPTLECVYEVGETIEMIYKQTSQFSRTGGLPPYSDDRVFKIIYSCKDGKWNKSEPIYGKIIPSQDEYFEFNQ